MKGLYGRLYMTLFFFVFYLVPNLDAHSVVLCGCCVYEAFCRSPLIQCSFANTRSLHLYSINHGSITAQWGKMIGQSSVSEQSVSTAIVFSDIKHVFSVVKSLTGPQCQKAVIDSLPGQGRCLQLSRGLTLLTPESHLPTVKCGGKYIQLQGNIENKMKLVTCTMFKSCVLCWLTLVVLWDNINF